MAKAKRKATLSLEEKLEQALVPVEEQPYEVPENWCWTRISNVADVIMGQSPSGESTTDDDSYVPLIGGAADMGEILPKVSRYTKAPTKLSEPEDLILCIRATLGRPVYSDGEYCLGRGVSAIRSKYLSKEFLRYYYINNEQYLYDNATGTTFAQVTGKVLENMVISLPPLVEQERIVEQIESLFIKLDETKDKISNVLKRCNDNMTSMVHEAITGKLTEAWRREHGILKDDWVVDKLGNLGTLERGRSKYRPRNDSRLFGGPYPFIQTGDVAEANVYIEKHRQTLSEFGVQQSRIFPKGTLCITIAANIGDVAILAYDCCFPDSVVGFTPYENIESKYIYYVMRGLQKEIEANAPATAQKNINLKILNDIDIKVPTIIEQKKIIEILEELLSKEMEVKEKAKQTIDMIDMMKKSILAKAFHGKLGTNNSNDESAMELLKTILCEE